MKEDSEDLIQLENPNQKNDNKEEIKNIVDSLNKEEKKNISLDEALSSIDLFGPYLKDSNEKKYNELTSMSNLKYYFDLRNSMTKDEEVRKKINNALDLYITKIKIAGSETNKVLESMQKGSIDVRDIFNISLFYDGTKKDNFNENKYKEDVNKIASSFFKYNAVKKDRDEIVKNDPNYIDSQLKEVNPYLKTLNDFFINDFIPLVEKYNYNFDFDLMDEEDIYKFVCAYANTQTFLTKNNEYPLYAKNNYKTYKEINAFNKALMIINNIGLYIPEQIDRYGYDTAIQGFRNNFAFLIDEQRDNEYLATSSFRNFIRDNSQVVCDLPDNFLNKEFDETTPPQDFFKRVFCKYLDSGKIINKTIDGDWYKIVFIDGKPLYDYTFAGLSQNEIPDYNQGRLEAMSKKLIDIIKDGTKLIELAYVTDFGEKFVLDTKTVTFNSRILEVDNKYQETLKNQAINYNVRHDSIESYIKKNVIDFRANGVQLYPSADVVSKNFIDIMDKVDSLLNDANNPEISKSEAFKEFKNNLVKDYESIIPIVKSNYDAEVDKSPLFNKEVLDESYQNIYKISSISDIFSNYITNVEGAVYNKAIIRDLSPYFRSLKGLTLEERIVKSLKYVNAIVKRENKDFSESRIIQKELIEQVLNTSTNYNFNSKNDIYNLYVNTHLAITLNEMKDSDQSVFDELKDKEPEKYFTLVQKLKSFEDINFYYKKEINSQLKYNYKYNYSADNYTMLDEDVDFGSTLNNDRNTSAFLIAMSNARDAKEVDLNLDLSIFGIAKQTNFDFVDFSHTSIDKMLDAFKTDDFGDFVNYNSNMKPLTLALHSVEKMLSCLASANNTNDFTKTFANYIGEDFEFGPHYIEHLSRSLYINNLSIYDRAQNYLNNSEKLVNNQKPSLSRVVTCLLLKALSNPQDTLSYVSLSFDNNNKLSPKAVLLNKNYDFVKSQVETHHTSFAKFFHNIGLYKYHEEKVVEEYNNTLDNLDKKDLLNNIESDFKFAHEGILETYNDKEKFKEFLNNYKDRQIEFENKKLQEANNEKDKDIKIDKNDKAKIEEIENEKLLPDFDEISLIDKTENHQINDELVENLKNDLGENNPKLYKVEHNIEKNPNLKLDNKEHEIN